MRLYIHVHTGISTHMHTCVYSNLKNIMFKNFFLPFWSVFQCSNLIGSISVRVRVRVIRVVLELI